MAIIHRATLKPSKLELLAGWIGGQRWYAGKGGTPKLTLLGGYRFDDPAGQVGVEVNIVADSATGEPVVYQIPMTYRDAPLQGADPALIGEMEHSALGHRFIYDGCHDPVFVATLLRTMITGGRQAVLERYDESGNHVGAVDPPITVRGSGFRHAAVPRIRSSRVLSGEQSNTSIIVESDDEEPLIIKVFRVIHAGDNPDVTLQAALSHVGSERVPQMVASLRGDWPTPDGSGRAQGDLAFAQEFLPGVQDAWRVALEAAAEDRSFAASAYALGAATAEVHHQLAEAMPVGPSTPESVSRQLDAIRRRFAVAAESVPELRERQDEFDALTASAQDAEWPALQRIHGDLHLGQALDAPERGWVLLDFEGEPLRTLDERNEPDVPLRDIAGMLRSFDYAAGSIEQRDATADRRDWAAQSRAAFLDGYAAQSGVDLAPYRPLIELFEVDKASYEVVYEVRNRPGWLDIPRSAILRLLPTTKGDAMSDDRGEDTNEVRPAGEGRGATEGMSDDRGEDTNEVKSADTSVRTEVAHELLVGRYGDPHRILGPHVNESGALVRVFRPLANTVQVQLPDGTRTDLHHD